MDTAILQTYLHIVEEGSFSAAARRMKISRSLASKYISDLEAKLGTSLLARSTRSVRPTVIGHEYYSHVKEILSKLEIANDFVRQVSDRASGHLRVASPVAYTLKVLQQPMMRFIEKHPDIQLDLVLDERRNDLISEGFDAIIRVGELQDSSLFSRRLHSARSLIVASPDYLEKHGLPLHPSELTAHHCLHYTNMRGTNTWPFLDGHNIIHQRIHPFFSTNNGEILRTAALEGKGIAILADFLVENDLASGQLVELLTEFPLPQLPVNIIYPSAHNMTAALRAFINFLSQYKPHEDAISGTFVKKPVRDFGDPEPS